MASNDKGALLIPPVAQSDPDAFEIARVWVAAGEQHVSLRPDTWDDAGAWGIVLVDLAKHIANAHYEAFGRRPPETLKKIRAAFDAEWTSQLDLSGGFLA
jgi:hypothetical protein